MASLNKVMLIGNLGKDPEVRYTAAGTAVASFSVATSEKFKNKSGEWEEKTEGTTSPSGPGSPKSPESTWQRENRLHEGRLQTRKWQDRDGKDRYTTEIVGKDADAFR
jgi:single-strand DNA-binding protein